MTRIGKRKTPSPTTLQRHNSPPQFSPPAEATPNPRDVCDAYLRNAPDVLKVLHRPQQLTPYSRLLNSLLTDPKMKSAWDEIAERRERVIAGFNQESDQDSKSHQTNWLHQRDFFYERLWREIKYARFECKSPVEPRSKIRQRFELIALDATKLAEAVSHGPLVLSTGLQRLREKSKRKTGYAPASAKSLGLLTYEFYPNEVAIFAFQNPNWARLNSDERDSLAFRVLRDTSWPFIGDLFVEFAERAFREAQKVASTRRIVDRNTEHRSLNVFVQLLHERFFQRFLNGTMAGTLARIASVALSKEVTKNLVLEALSSRDTKTPSIPPAAPRLL